RPHLDQQIRSDARRKYPSVGGEHTAASTGTIGSDYHRTRRGKMRRENSMASIEQFNDHCWKDVIPENDLRLYSGWRRETFVGPRPALLAIDLYDLVYRGGARPRIEINEQYPNTCGIFAYRAIAPTKRLFAAARSAGIPIFY